MEQAPRLRDDDRFWRQELYIGQARIVASLEHVLTEGIIKPLRAFPPFVVVVIAVANAVRHDEARFNLSTLLISISLKSSS